MNNFQDKSILCFRLSSLGDVILATAALSELPAGTSVDWVIQKEFAPLLDGHPAIRRLWIFDKKTGLGGWIRLCRELHGQGYRSVLDLHRSLRTRIAAFLFWFWSLGTSSSRKPTSWRVLSKQRLRLYGYFLFKGLWPKSWRPEPLVRRFSRLVGGAGTGRPSFPHWLQPVKRFGRPHVCVMAGSRWPGKCWPAEGYFEVIQGLGLLPVILGSPKDQESMKLVELLRAAGVEHVSGVGQWSIRETAEALAGAKAYLGNDTGFAHLAEALGVPAWMIFGPTTPEMGFGPWREASRTCGTPLWCRPCGKDGRYCFRPLNRFRCMKDLGSKRVLEDLRP